MAEFAGWDEFPLSAKFIIIFTARRTGGLYWFLGDFKGN